MNTAPAPHAIAAGPKKAYTVDEAAALLSIGRVTLYELINSGELRSIKLRNCRRIPADAIDELLARDA